MDKTIYGPMHRAASRQWLLTGTTGFLGAYFALYLLNNTNARLLCLARDRLGVSAEARVKERLKKLLQGGLQFDCRFSTSIEDIERRVCVVHGDIRQRHLGLNENDYNSLNVDAIWHCAADVNFAEHRRRQVMETNYEGTLNVLKFAQDRSVPEMNYISTAYVCGDRGGEIPEAPYDTHSATNNVYEESKRLCEQAVLQAYHDVGLNFRIFRPAIIVGHSRTMEVDSSSGLYGYLSAMLRLKDAVLSRMPEFFSAHTLKILCDDDVTLNLVCVDRVAEAMVKIIDKGNPSLNSFYHIVNPSPLSVANYTRCTLTEIFEIGVEHTTDESQLNAIDALMNNETDIYRAYLRKNKIFRNDNTLRHSGMANSCFVIDRDTEYRLSQSIYADFNEDARIQRARRRSVTQALSLKTLSRNGQPPLNYYSGGSGPETLVIINAYGQSLAFWDYLVGQLMGLYRIVIWQARGSISHNGGIEHVYPISEHVMDMFGIFESEQITRAHVLGWCTGPKIALEFYAAHPQRVTSLMFLTGCFIYDSALKHLYTEYENYMDKLCRMVDQRPEIAGQLAETLKKVLTGKNRTSDKIMSANSHEPLLNGVLALISEDIKPLVLEPFLTHSSIVNYARQLLAFWSYDVSDILPKLAIPVLFIGGEADNIVSAKLVKEISRHVPRAIYMEIQGGSHYMQRDNYVLLSEILKSFMHDGYQTSFSHGLVRANTHANKTSGFAFEGAAIPQDAYYPVRT